MKTILSALTAACVAVLGCDYSESIVHVHVSGAGGEGGGGNATTTSQSGTVDAGYPASCGNGVRDGNETDVDCGGVDCPGCADGQNCDEHTDCGASDAWCSGRTCSCTLMELVISEVQVSGPNGRQFVEIWNPYYNAISLDAVRVQVASPTAHLTTVWTGSSGLYLHPGQHLLIVNDAWSGPPANGLLSKPLPSEGTVRLVLPDGTADGRAGDSVCFYRDKAAAKVLSLLDICEGEPVFIGDGPDESIERLPGSSAGHCQDGNGSAHDFARGTATPMGTWAPAVQ